MDMDMNKICSRNINYKTDPIRRLKTIMMIYKDNSDSNTICMMIKMVMKIAAVIPDYNHYYNKSGNYIK